jgi:hypothetical protein
MSNAAMWTAIIGSIMALTLAGSSLRSFRLEQSKTIQLALIWIAIIAGLTLTIGYLKP